MFLCVESAAVFLLLLSSVATTTRSANVSSTLTCRNSVGTAVSWWVLYKQPGGTNFAYLDSKSASSTSFNVDPDSDLGSSSSPAGVTLEPIFQDISGNEFAYLAYNDEKPNGQTDSVKAHAKGVIAMDISGNQGFWLIHSVPKYPDFDASQYYYSGSEIYGQSFLCISLENRDTIATVSKTLRYDGPNVYAHNNIENVGIGDLTAVINGQFMDGTIVQDIPFSVASVNNITTGPAVFTVFGKSRSWGQDLYEDLVEPYLKLPFRWETWRRAGQDSDCTWNSSAEYDTMNVEYMDFRAASGDPLAVFRYTKDHSKLGLTSSSSASKWVCIGDINRMQSQAKRGGGTACLQNDILWDAINSVIYISDSCSQRDENPLSSTKPQIQQRLNQEQDSSKSLSSLGNYSALLCDCQFNPFYKHAVQSRQETIENVLVSKIRTRNTLAVCNNDAGWLNSTARCPLTRAALACVAKVVRTEPNARSQTICDCITSSCINPRSESLADYHSTAISSSCLHDSAANSAQTKCYDTCWNSSHSSCADADDLQATCVYFCTEYCLRHQPCTKTDTKVNDMSGTSQTDVEPDSTHLRCRRDCARKHMDPFWNSPIAGEHLDDFAMCALKC